MGKKEMIRLPVVPFDSGRNQRGNTNPNKNKGLHFAAIWGYVECHGNVDITWHISTPPSFYIGVKQKCNDKEGFNSLLYLLFLRRLLKAIQVNKTAAQIVSNWGRD